MGNYYTVFVKYRHRAIPGEKQPWYYIQKRGLFTLFRWVDHKVPSPSNNAVQCFPTEEQAEIYCFCRNRGIWPDMQNLGLRGLQERRPKTIGYHLFRAFFAITGWHSIQNGRTCRYDLHDYLVKHGGDGHPSHMHVYQCPRCGKKFRI